MGTPEILEFLIGEITGDGTSLLPSIPNKLSIHVHKALGNDGEPNATVTLLHDDVPVSSGVGSFDNQRRPSNKGRPRGTSKYLAVALAYYWALGEFDKKELARDQIRPLFRYSSDRAIRKAINKGEAAVKKLMGGNKMVVAAASRASGARINGTLLFMAQDAKSQLDAIHNGEKVEVECIAWFEDETTVRGVVAQFNHQPLEEKGHRVKRGDK